MENKSNNKIVVPEAKAAMEQFKMQAANDVDVKMYQKLKSKDNLANF